MIEGEVRTDKETSVYKDAGQDFADYASNIVEAIQEAMQRAEMDSIQVLAVMIQLSSAETKEELEATIERLKEKYPALAEVSYKERVEVEESLDEIVQGYVSYLIKSGKVKEADQFAKTAQAEGATSESLESAYPDFSEYLNQSK